MRVHATAANPDDLAAIEVLYRGLEREMEALHRMWPKADGLDEPVGEALRLALDSPEALLLVGWIDDVPFGFLLARVEGMLTQASGEKIGAIRLIYVDPEAREVAVGEAMRDKAMEMLRGRGISKFDAHVLPGHRLAKNFFEAGGFAARSIIMHHDDDR
jgi:ribosomal protein S18 acetylase RimI-like enzyme